MMEKPTDPDKLAVYYMYQGAAVALTKVFDSLNEIQIMHIDQVWDPAGPEYQAVAEAFEAFKVLIANSQNQIINEAIGLLDD
jgi:hypothetical protein